mgnify:CR=1 FL=1
MTKFVLNDNIIFFTLSGVLLHFSIEVTMKIEMPLQGKWTSGKFIEISMSHVSFGGEGSILVTCCVPFFL